MDTRKSLSTKYHNNCVMNENKIMLPTILMTYQWFNKAAIEVDLQKLTVGLALNEVSLKSSLQMLN